MTGCAARGSSSPRRARSDRVLVELAGADADDVIDRRHEDLAVTDLARLRSLDDRVDAALSVAVLDDDLDLDLGQEVDDVLGAAVELGVAFLTAKALDLGHGQARHADVGQRLAHLLELERLDDGGDLLHWTGSARTRMRSSVGDRPGPAAARRRRCLRRRIG